MTPALLTPWTVRSLRAYTWLVRWYPAGPRDARTNKNSLNSSVYGDNPHGSQPWIAALSRGKNSV